MLCFSYVLITVIVLGCKPKVAYYENIPSQCISEHNKVYYAERKEIGFPRVKSKITLTNSLLIFTEPIF